MAWQIDDISVNPSWLETIVDWHHAEWLRSGDWQTLSAERISKSRQERLDYMREHFLNTAVPSTFVAHDNTQPWGTISIVNYRLEATKPAGTWLTNLFVAPNYRKQGAGASLLSYLEQWADANNLGVLRLYTFDAMDYYLNRGWTYERSTELHGGIVDILKRLPQA